MHINVINNETGFLSTYTARELARTARILAKSYGKYEYHHLTFTEGGRAKLEVTFKRTDGWSEQISTVL